jgi:hypothetical protein
MASTGTYINGITYAIPGTGGTSGSVAANYQIISFQAVDAHAHTGLGDGRKLTTASFSVDANLVHNGFAGTQIKYHNYVNNSVTPATPFSVFILSGDLYYNNGSTDIRLTSGSTLNTGTLGVLQGIVGDAAVSYTSGNSLWKMISEVGSIYADLQIKDLIQTSSSSPYASITLKVGTPTSGYDVIWPAADPTLYSVPMINNATTGQLIWQKVGKVSGSNTANEIAYFSDASTITGIGLTSGQILIGRDGLTPLPIKIAGTTNQVDVANSATGITISAPQNIHAAATPTFAGMTLTGALGYSRNFGTFKLLMVSLIM